jgi:hypothetical protein
MAARTAIEAVDAATATEPPSQRTAARTQPASPTILPPQNRVPQIRVAHALNAASAARAGVMSPLKNASRALWHELTGSFFALFALSFGIAVWRTRASAMSTIPNDRYRFYGFCAFALLFGYFSVSSFLRARRR